MVGKVKNESSREKNNLKKGNNKEKSMVTATEGDAEFASNASNYNALGYQVDPRTGALNVTITPPPLGGFFGASITPAIHYTQTNMSGSLSMYGLPIGWIYYFSFIHNNKLYINGGTSYYIDNTYPSGLKYYKAKNLVFTQYEQPHQFPYNTNLSYSYLLKYCNGDKQYFDRYGRLIGLDDRFGNHVMFQYVGEGDAYHSKIAKIINAVGQETTFQYASNSIKVIYPQNGHNNIIFSYVTDNNNYLVKYINPLEQETIITNKGGNQKNLISEIAQYNGLKISYHYTNIMYCVDLNKDTYKKQNTISEVKLKSGLETRKIKYTYNPYKSMGPTNYTGCPDCVVERTRDTLLESNDNSYRYITQEDNGILITEHHYNHLHLEVETKVFTVKKPRRLINHILNTYQGQDSNGNFSNFTDLPSNYETPIKIVTDTYNVRRDRRRQTIETNFDEYGNPTEVKTYVTDNKTHQESLISMRKITYFDYERCCGLMQSQTIYDYATKDGISTAPTSIRRTENTLTPHEDDMYKSIATTLTGFVVIENNQEIFKPEKKASYKYNTQGQVISEKMEWVDGKDHDLKSTLQTTSYGYSSPFIQVCIEHPENEEPSSMMLPGTLTCIAMPTGWIHSTCRIRPNYVSSETWYATYGYEYDNIGRKITVYDPMRVMTKWIYDDVANKITTRYAAGIAYGDDNPNCYETYSYYNAFGELIKTADNMGPNGTERVLSTKTYNHLGQLISEEGILGEYSKIKYHYNDRGELYYIEDALGNVTEYNSDPVSKTKITSYNDRKISETQYEGNTGTSVTYSTPMDISLDDKIIEATNAYNSASKMISHLLGNKSSNEWYETDYTYAADYNISSFNVDSADGIKGTHSFERDLLGNSILETVDVSLPGENRRSATGDRYIYNHLNQLVEVRNSLGQSCYYTYDDLGRQETYKDYAETVFTSDYNVYNQLTSVTAVAKGGSIYSAVRERRFYDALTYRLTSIEGGGRSISYTYLKNGQLETITYPDGKKIHYNYDLDKNLLSEFIDALGQVTKYSYDDYGRIIKIQIDETGYSVNFSYYTKEEDAVNSGKIKSIKVKNLTENQDREIEKRYTYDEFRAVGSLTIINNKIEGPNNILLKTEYSYDGITSNISKIKYSSTVTPEDSRVNHLVEYNYNSLNQLIVEKRLDLLGRVLTTTNYKYDGVNNVIEEKIAGNNGGTEITTYIYDLDNKLVQINKNGNKLKLDYDVNGNLINDGINAYTYNERNQLVKYKSAGVETVYTYYPNGLRATKQTTGTNDLITFYYDNATNANIINEVQSDKSTSYLMLGSERYIRLWRSSGQTLQQSAPQYFIDNLKDTIGLLNRFDEYQKVFYYDPYGQQLNPIVTLEAQDISNNPFRYSSEYWDRESGLIYLRSRYYNPGLKRFISRDKTALINRYSYADGNPIMNIDPSGAYSGNVSGGIIAAASITGLVVGVGVTAAGFAILGPSIGVALIIGGIAGGASTLASNGVLIAGGAKFTKKDWGVSIGSGVAAGVAAVAGGGIANIASVRVLAAVTELSSGELGNVGGIASIAGGSFSASFTSAGIEAGAYDNKTFFSKETWESVALNTAIGAFIGTTTLTLGTIRSNLTRLGAPGILPNESPFLLDMNPREEGDWMKVMNITSITIEGETRYFDTIIVHGGPGFVAVDTMEGAIKIVSPEAFGDYIQAQMYRGNPAFGGRPIKLISCYGATRGALASVAQTLADRIGVEVYAAEGSIYNSHESPWVRFPRNNGEA